MISQHENSYYMEQTRGLTNIPEYYPGLLNRRKYATSKCGNIAIA